MHRGEDKSSAAQKRREEKSHALLWVESRRFAAAPFFTWLTATSLYQLTNSAPWVNEPQSIRRGRAGCYTETARTVPSPVLSFFFSSYFTGTRSEREPPSYTYTLVNGGQVGGGMQQPPPPPPTPTQKKKKERRREWKGCVSFLVVLVVPDRIRKNTNWNSWKSHPMMMETKHAHHHHVFLSLWWYYYVRSEIIPTIGRWNNSLSQCLQIVYTRKVSRQTGTNHIESTTTTTQRLRT